ncbi:MAG: hypothetical protein P1U47_06035 [Zhongshania sp.]|uniref:hypothetical protein n=1 Tax=Zhongshania sp. TaxID=1971902 RepID=UPI00260BE9D7|nr:hypothetical protein [Zhongshania sp.]MDF1691910.1 hypothetical protein [Zhongshania sp.]
MTMRFLCETHRQQLLRSQAVAEIRWDEWMEAGREALSQKDWRAALKYLGSSYELSEVLLTQCSVPDLAYLDRYMVSGHFLAECLRHCGELQLQRHCLLEVHYRLLAILRSPQGQGLPLQRNIEISLQMLTRHYDATGEVDSFLACRAETQRLLQRSVH